MPPSHSPSCRPHPILGNVKEWVTKNISIKHCSPDRFHKVANCPTLKVVLNGTLLCYTKKLGLEELQWHCLSYHLWWELLRSYVLNLSLFEIRHWQWVALSIPNQSQVLPLFTGLCTSWNWEVQDTCTGVCTWVGRKTCSGCRLMPYTSVQL